MNVLKRAIRAGLLVILWCVLVTLGLTGLALAGIVYLVAFVIGLPIVLVLIVCHAAAEEVRKCSGY